jgi:hypothetical protein
LTSLRVALSNLERKVISRNRIKPKEKQMSFWSSLEADVNKGLEVAAVVIGTFLPADSVLLEDIAEAVSDIENIFAKPVAQVPAATVSSVTQAATTMSAIKQASAAKKVSS